jgi:RNA polymerase sigma-70 factor, ECF subfamily
MRRAPGFPTDELTFLLRLSTLLTVEPEIDRPSDGGGADLVADQVRRAQAGDPEAYRQLFRLYARRVHRLIYRLVGPTDEVEDLVQATFAEAFAGLPGFRGDAAFFTWLGRIAVRTALRRRRHPALAPLPLDEATAAADVASPEAASDARRALARFDGILARLSDKRRAAFVLHVLEGHSLDEVAVLVDAKLAAVKVRIHDARVAIEREARRDPFLVHYLRWEAS